MPSTYLELLHRARAMENDAIAIGLQLIAVAPAQDVPRLAEIANDENSHDRIYVDIISQQEMMMPTNDSLGARVAARVADALTQDYNENHDEHGRFAVGDDTQAFQAHLERLLRVHDDTQKAFQASGRAIKMDSADGGRSRASDKLRRIKEYASSASHTAMTGTDQGDTAMSHSRAAAAHIEAAGYANTPAERNAHMDAAEAHLKAMRSNFAVSDAKRSQLGTHNHMDEAYDHIAPYPPVAPGV